MVLMLGEGGMGRVFIAEHTVLGRKVAVKVLHPQFENNPEFAERWSHDRLAAHRVNVGGTSNLLDASAEAGVRRIVYLSSTSVYGAHADNPPMLTESSPARPVRGFQYSEDKAEAERQASLFEFKEDPWEKH